MEETHSEFVERMAERILLAWCSNPQMFSDGAHVPYANLLVNAREFAELAWLAKGSAATSAADLKKVAKGAGLEISDSMFEATNRGGH